MAIICSVENKREDYGTESYKCNQDNLVRRGKYDRVMALDYSVEDLRFVAGVAQAKFSMP